MTFDEYQLAAQRTSNTASYASSIDNGILGLCGEVGEVADLIKKARYQGHSLDIQRLIEELGDVMWYIAELASGLNVTLEEIAQANIEKLQKRYPNGFDAERSVHRADWT